jgi:hypothetical protein
MVLSYSTLIYRLLIAALYFNIPIVSAVYSLVFRGVATLKYSSYERVCRSVTGEVLLCFKQDNTKKSHSAAKISLGRKIRPRL